MNIEYSIVINQPLEDVFAYLSNLENLPNHERSVVDAKKLSDGAIGVGTQFRVTGKILAGKTNAVLQMTEWEPNRKFAFKSAASPFAAHTSYTFKPAEGRTRLAVNDETQPSGLLKLLGPLLPLLGYNERRFEADMRNLKRFLESNRMRVRQPTREP